MSHCYNARIFLCLRRVNSIGINITNNYNTSCDFNKKCYNKVNIKQHKPVKHWIITNMLINAERGIGNKVCREEENLDVIQENFLLLLFSFKYFWYFSKFEEKKKISKPSKFSSPSSYVSFNNYIIFLVMKYIDEENLNSKPSKFYYSSSFSFIKYFWYFSKFEERRKKRIWMSSKIFFFFYFFFQLL